MSHLVIENLRKTYGSFVALHSVNLSVNEGEFLVLLGPSGCGKTTLLRAIAGLDIQDSGRIVHAGQDITTLPASARDYGIVFQSYALFPNLTVAENIAYGLKSRTYVRKNGASSTHQRVHEMLSLVGLPGIESKHPSQLSGGQQQRVALARALATSPDMLLLDEPLSALDAIERVRLRSEIRNLQKRLGVTTIMVTHDQEEALAMADRIVVMSQGHLVQVGNPRDIYESPQNAFVANFIGRGSWIRADELGSLAPSDLPTDSLCFIRPEDITWHDSSAINMPSLQVKVDKIEYLGSHSLVSLSTMSQSQTLILAQFSSQELQARPLCPGSSIKVGIRAQAFRPINPS